MEESTLEESITSYKQQLIQIDTLLQCCEDENKHELINLRKDITDLIKITEESLLSLKKSRLLQQISEQDNEVYEEKEDSSSSFSYNENEDDIKEHDFLGIKCRVRHSHDWGQTDYHNAMVLDTEETEDGDHKVKVLFMNPTHKSMVPCSYFLDGKCKFTEEKCRFSHGYLTDISELEEYSEPDFRKINDDTIEIHYDTYNTDAVLDIHDVLPIEVRNNDYESSDESIIDEENSKDIHEENYVAQISMNSILSTGPLGEWERHTKGIGSKLMAKMGYQFGKGLGKDGEGRVEPIEIVILPAGKSLDKVAELREKGQLHKPLRKRKSKSKLAEGAGSSGGNSSASSIQETDVFEFINRKLTHGASHSTLHFNQVDGNKHKVKHNIEESYQQLKNIRKNKSKGMSTKQAHAGPNWNLQLFKNNEKAMALRKRLTKQKESLKRNLGRDNEMVSRLKASINALENELRELEHSGKTIENKLHSKQQHRKLTVF
eukprot:gene10687-19455_t